MSNVGRNFSVLFDLGSTSMGLRGLFLSFTCRGFDRVNLFLQKFEFLFKDFYFLSTAGFFLFGFYLALSL
jgi:hypothetical protein